jgi:uncharacterized protein (DUF3820 family)
VIRLAYTQYHREFVCKIENIGELSVQTLQGLEDFAAQRSGKLDYNTESFTIPKRIELQHLQEIFKAKGMDVFITEHEPKKNAISQSATINFGKFKGQKWTDLDEEYLVWLSQNISSQDRQVALAELDRRKKNKTPEKRTETVMFGKHKGELWDDLPTPYLQWVAQNLQGESQNIAMDVLQRRQ